MNAAKRAEIYRRWRSADPHPTTELNYRNPFQLLVAVVLSAQATDVGVNKATGTLFQRVDKPEDILELGEDGLKSYIRTIGLFNTKAKHIIKTCEILIDKHAGEVPQTRAALEALPGVGHKTASVVMAQAFGVSTFPVDTHIHRLAARWGLSDGRNVVKTERDLKRVFREQHWNALHLQIIYFGREYCPARGHDLTDCPICSWVVSKTRIASEGTGKKS